jgi:large subunit ribosomal protein L10
VVKSFAAEFQRPTLKSGVLDGTLLSAAEVGALADVGSRNNMLAKLLGTINAPASALARVIQAKFGPDGAESADSAETPAAADAPAAAETPAAE